MAGRFNKSNVVLFWSVAEHFFTSKNAKNFRLASSQVFCSVIEINKFLCYLLHSCDELTGPFACRIQFSCNTVFLCLDKCFECFLSKCVLRIWTSWNFMTFANKLSFKTTVYSKLTGGSEAKFSVSSARLTHFRQATNLLATPDPRSKADGKERKCCALSRNPRTTKNKPN